MKSFQNLFLMLLVSSSILVAKPVVVQSDIFYEISKGNTSAIRAWLKTKPDLFVKNNNGQTLLGAAVAANKKHVVTLLVKAGVDVNALDHAKKTALDHAVESENLKISAILAKYHGKVTSAENMYRFKDMVRAYSVKLWIRSFILGFVVCAVGVIAFFVCPQIVLWSVQFVAAYGTIGGVHSCVEVAFFACLIHTINLTLSVYAFVLQCRAISWNRLANRFDTILTESAEIPVALEK